MCKVTYCVLEAPNQSLISIPLAINGYAVDNREKLRKLHGKELRISVRRHAILRYFVVFINLS